MGDYSSIRRDKAIADDHLGNSSLSCAAHGCQLNWSVDFGGPKLCDYHHGKDMHLWPRITQEVQDMVAARASRSIRESVRLSEADKRAVIERLKRSVREFGAGPKNPKEWADTLHRRDEEGERLTQAQRTMWREAKGFHQ